MRYGGSISIRGWGSLASTYLSTEYLLGISVEMFLQRGGRFRVMQFENLVLCVTAGVRVFETQLTVSNYH